MVAAADPEGDRNRRETISTYLKDAGVELRSPRARLLRPKPASCPDRVITDSDHAECADPVVTAGLDTAKPASVAGQVITNSSPHIEDTSGVTSPPEPSRSPSSSACEAYRDAIELGLSQGRNAKAIWQDLVDTYHCAAGYQSVRRFVHQIRGRQSPEACAVIETSPGEDYGESAVMVRTASRVARPQRRAAFLAVPKFP